MDLSLVGLLDLNYLKIGLLLRPMKEGKVSTI